MTRSETPIRSLMRLIPVRLISAAASVENVSTTFGRNAIRTTPILFFQTL